jgi:hypothetical protein
LKGSSFTLAMPEMPVQSGALMCQKMLPGRSRSCNPDFKCCCGCHCTSAPFITPRVCTEQLRRSPPRALLCGSPAPSQHCPYAGLSMAPSPPTCSYTTASQVPPSGILSHIYADVCVTRCSVTWCVTQCSVWHFPLRCQTCSTHCMAMISRH